MGQYFKFAVLESNKRNYPNKKKVIASLSPYDYDNGAKLMEFGWVDNDYCNAFEELINKEHGKYAGYPVICAGDYADEEPYTYNNEKVTIYDLIYDLNTDIKDTIQGKHYRYVINEDKKLYIDSDKVPNSGWKNEWKVNPLVIMVCDGCGRGCGDFHSDNKLVGSWKRNVVVTSDNKPDDTYKELVVDFQEKW